MQEIESNLCPTVACDPLDTQIANRVLRHAQVHRVQHTDANELDRKRRQREQRVDTDPCSVWLASSSDVRYRDLFLAAGVEVPVHQLPPQPALHLQNISLEV